jgi:flavin reductase (DIM6/NTAB) family NADH-FMN oxidoreductase RutF
MAGAVVDASLDMVDLPGSFRAAMRGLASTVCVVAANTPAGPRGMTATALVSLSLEPPTLAVAINRKASLHADLVEGAPLSIQLLSEGQADLAKAFAGGLRPHERFSVGGWSSDARGAPMLEGACASLSCVIGQRVEVATHSLLIAQVLGVRAAPDARPLIYAHGRFTGLPGPDRLCVA